MEVTYGNATAACRLSSRLLLQRPGFPAPAVLCLHRPRPRCPRCAAAHLEGAILADAEGVREVPRNGLLAEHVLRALRARIAGRDSTYGSSAGAPCSCVAPPSSQCCARHAWPLPPSLSTLAGLSRACTTPLLRIRLSAYVRPLLSSARQGAGKNGAGWSGLGRSKQAGAAGHPMIRCKTLVGLKTATNLTQPAPSRPCPLLTRGHRDSAERAAPQHHALREHQLLHAGAALLAVFPCAHGHPRTRSQRSAEMLRCHVYATCHSRQSEPQPCTSPHVCSPATQPLAVPAPATHASRSSAFHPLRCRSRCCRRRRRCSAL